MGGRRGITLCAAAAVLLAHLPAEASPQPDPGLWLIGSDGTGAREIDTRVDQGSGYDWSPDGSLLAYGTGDIWVLDVATGETVNLTATPLVHEIHPSWSPDGDRIAFSREFDVWVMDADGSDALPLTEGDAYDRWPSWAPGGDLVSFRRVFPVEQSTTIHVVQSDGGPSVALAEVATPPYSTSWSPDGREIALASPSHEVRVVDVATGATRTVASDGFSPSWAPAGDRIAYGSPDGVFVVSLTDGSVTKLTEGAADAWGNIAWSPDGSSVAVGGYEIRVIDVATGSVVAVTEGERTEEEYAPLWSPAGDLIAYVGIVWCCLPHYYDRRIDLVERGHLVLSGQAHSIMPPCSEGTPVNVRRRSGDRWKTIRRVVAGDDGSFRVRLRDRPGLYRVVTPEQKVTFEGARYTCLRSVSPTVRHRH